MSPSQFLDTNENVQSNNKSPSAKIDLSSHGFFSPSLNKKGNYKNYETTLIEPSKTTNDTKITKLKEINKQYI